MRFTRFLGVTGRFDKFGCKLNEGFVQCFGPNLLLSVVLSERLWFLHNSPTDDVTPFKFNRGTTKDTRGTAFVVYEDIYDAKTACEHLSGFNVHNRYLIVLYHNTVKRHAKENLATK